MITKALDKACHRMDLYVSSDCWVGRSLNDLFEEREAFHLLPANRYALLATIPSSYPPLLTVPTYGCILYRPKLLELVFPQNTIVTLHSLRIEDMQSWCKDSLPWVRVGKPKAITRGNTW